MDDPNRHSSHAQFAGRKAAGTELPVTLAKNGVRHIRRNPGGAVKETLAVGLACSECFSGPRLAKLLKPGFDYEREVMEKLMQGDYAAPLSIHTSGGVSEALTGFVNELEKHLPFEERDDWCVSLQLEGASAVWAGVDMLLQERILTTGEKTRTKVAVGGCSYHGPPSTSFGAKSTLWRKHHQLKYPVPSPMKEVDEESLIEKYEQFLDEHAEEIGVLLVEPQWGSSQAAFPWPTSLLKKYISMAKQRGIRVLADEIMCGLGRHGKGTLFVSNALELDVDAVTFGKAMGGGVYPISGAIIRQGKRTLQMNKCSVMQSHTYAGSSTRALMTATAVLKEIPLWLPSISKLGEEMEHIFGYLERMSKGMIKTQGQGLMWGCMFTREGANSSESNRLATFQTFQKYCEEVGVIPYFVPVGGFMVTPVVDIDVGTIYEIGEKLEKVIMMTMKERNWDSSNTFPHTIPEEKKVDDTVCDPSSVCLPSPQCMAHLHETRSCTACAKFVCQSKRMRFVSSVL